MIEEASAVIKNMLHLQISNFFQPKAAVGFLGLELRIQVVLIQVEKTLVSITYVM